MVTLFLVRNDEQTYCSMHNLISRFEPFTTRSTVITLQDSISDPYPS